MYDTLQEPMVNCLRRGASGEFSPAFQRRDQAVGESCRVATTEFELVSTVATRREYFVPLSPALKGRAKFTSTLRVERNLLRAS
jgi:hypothetical protein